MSVELFDGDEGENIPMCAYTRIATIMLAGISPKVHAAIVFPKETVRLGATALVMMEAARQSPEWFEAMIRKFESYYPADEWRYRMEQSARAIIEHHPVAMQS